MTTANHARSFYGGPSASKAKFVCKLARLELGRFIRIVTGHSNLNFFQHKLGLSGTDECRFCNQGNETIMHLMKVCPRFVLARREILLNRVPDGSMSWSVRDLLNFSYVPGINEAYEGRGSDGDGGWGGGEGELDDTLDLHWLDSDCDQDHDDPLGLQDEEISTL